MVKHLTHRSPLCTFAKWLLEIAVQRPRILWDGLLLFRVPLFGCEVCDVFVIMLVLCR